MDEPVLATASIEATAPAEAPVLDQAEGTEEDKDEKIKRLESKVLSLQRKVRTLEQQLKRTTKALNDFLNTDQILALGKKSRKGHKWSNITVKSALQLRFACGIKGYNCILKLNYPLPSDRTLSRRLEGFKFYPGVQEEIFEFLRIKVDFMNEKERMCVLLMDEMAIEERVELDRSSKPCLGNCDPDEGAQLADFLNVSGPRVEEVQEEETSTNFEGTCTPLDAVDQGSLYYLSGFVVKQVCQTPADSHHDRLFQ
ncbi:uncharacterized protein LOC124167641 [Ischnura elegans]|uniref:uncharacterized protein LOC124167641 n=1 Tax=Ischnura elegans TaxID=197161 RepID=UPI001ED88DAD|nr:uncharacterized protein LOC124167641 [Ischnura elegans]